jgi:hypothetical protein
MSGETLKAKTKSKSGQLSLQTGNNMRKTDWSDLLSFVSFAKVFSPRSLHEKHENENGEDGGRIPLVLPKATSALGDRTSRL